MAAEGEVHPHLQPKVLERRSGSVGENLPQWGLHEYPSEQQAAVGHREHLHGILHRLGQHAHRDVHARQKPDQRAHDGVAVANRFALKDASRNGAVQPTEAP